MIKTEKIYKEVPVSERLPEMKAYYNCIIQGQPVVYWIDKSNGMIVRSDGTLIPETMWDAIKWLEVLDINEYTKVAYDEGFNDGNNNANMKD